MRDSSSNRCETRSAVSTAIARARAEGAESSEHAVIVGDRAGVVGWANAAWSRITGFPLAETVHKPITHFLDVAGIELELVDFVGQHFLEGRSSIIEFPFETFDGRRIEVRLEVQPVRDAPGELDGFIAIAHVIAARDASDKSASDDASDDAAPGDADRATLASPPNRRLERPERTSGDSQETARQGKPARAMSAGRSEGISSISLSDCVRRACQSPATIERERAGGKTRFDVCLAPNLPEIEMRAERLSELTGQLIEAAIRSVADSWGTVSVLTGRTKAHRSHVSQVHPVPARPPELAVGPHLYLEIHDTGPPLDRAALTRIHDRRAGSSEREALLVEALQTCDELGATLHIDCTPGCGNQSLVLIPLRPNS